MKRTVLVLTVATMALGALAAARAQEGPAIPDEAALAKDPKLFLKLARTLLKWDEAAEPTKILGPLYFVGTKGLAVYLITTAQGHILIHTGMPGSGPLIAASIRKLGFRPEDIKLLLVGHAHIDHVGDHAYIQKLSGAQVAASNLEVELTESGGKTDFHYGTAGDFTFEPVKVGRVLHDGDVLKIGDVALTALVTPGHTQGSTTYIANLVDGGRVYTVVFPNGTSINPGYRVAKDPSYPGIADDYRRTFHVLEMIKADVWLDGHNDVYDLEGKRARAAREGVAAWVDPAGYRKWLRGVRDKFEAKIDAETGAVR